MAANVVSVEEFVPDGGVIDRSFLEDSTPVQNTAIQQSVDSDRLAIFLTSKAVSTHLPYFASN